MHEAAVAPVEAAADPLRPFVPRLALEWLRDAPGERHRAIEGTLVFADVSGFTELTEALARRGREGAEEIAGVIDGAFSGLARRAYAYGGDLLKYGGDAMLLLFRGDGHTLRACAAAAGMQDALAGMRRRSTSAGPVRLQMSIGLHSGVFDAFLVGSVHRELVLAGPDATACVEAEGHARAGEIALSARTAELVGDALLGERRGPVALLAVAPEVAEHEPGEPPAGDAASLLPEAYTQELLGAPGDPEHRHVAVAFVELRGTDELMATGGADVVATALEERISAIQTACAEHHVTFAQTDVSSGAVKVILLAGAPRTAGGEEEELLLHTLRAIVEQSGRLPLRTGANAGRVFAGIVGTPERRTYTFYGDTINTAARIMARASDGQLLAHDTVLAHARTAFATTPIAPFTARGKSEPVRASSVGAPIGAREREEAGPFVGREAEQAALARALALAADGHGSVALVSGAPGLGKTRLLHELAERARDVRIVRVHCSHADVRHPYSAAGALLRSALGSDRHAAPALVERRLREAVDAAGGELEPWLPLLGLVAGIALPPTPATDALEERFVSERIAVATARLLDGLLPGTTLVVIDDAHWMDEASAGLVAHVAAGIRSRPRLLVLARRDDDPLAAELGEPLELRLAPLGQDAALELVRRSTDDAPLAAHVAEEIAERSDGSPLFVNELLQAMREGADHSTLPESVEDLMALQIDELAARDRAALRQASVLGTRFTRAALGTALELDAPAVEAMVARLSRFLESDADLVAFRHGLLRDAAYQGLSFRRRRTLHLRVGEALEEVAAGDADAAADLTFHFFEAGQWAKALRYGLVAGAGARAVYANVDAARVLERALAAGARWRAARPETVARAAEALADARISLGELEQARDALVVARRRVRGDAVERARILRKEGTVAYRLGALAEAGRILLNALGLVEEVQSAPATEQRARIEAQLGMVALWRGQPREAVGWFTKAIADGEAVDARAALAHALAGLDNAWNALGDERRSVHGERALEIYRELGDLVSQGGVLNNLGAMAYYAGRWNEALDLYGQALAAWERAGDTRSVSLASFNVGEILSAQGRLDEAEPLLREAERASRAAGGATDIAESLLERALLEARRGQIARALEQLDEARRLAAESGSRAALLLAEARRAEALRLGGEAERAVALAEQSLEAAGSDEGSALVLPVLWRVLGQARIDAGRHDDARAALERAIDEAERAEHRYEEAVALIALASLGTEPLSRAARRTELVDGLGIG